METSIEISSTVIDNLNPILASQKTNARNKSQVLSFFVEPERKLISVLIGAPDSIERIDCACDTIALRKPIDFSISFYYWRHALRINPFSSLLIKITSKPEGIKYDIAGVEPILDHTAEPAMKHHRQEYEANKLSYSYSTSCSSLSLLVQEINNLNPSGFVEVDPEKRIFLVERKKHVDKVTMPAHCKWQHSITFHKDTLPSLDNMQLGEPNGDIAFAQHDQELHLKSGNHSLSLSLPDRESFKSKPISELKTEVQFSCELNTLAHSLKAIKQALQGLETVYLYFQGRDITLTPIAENDKWVYPIKGQPAQRIDRKAYSLNLAEFIDALPKKGANDIHLEIAKNVQGEHAMKVSIGGKSDFVNMVCQNQAIPELERGLQKLKAKQKENTRLKNKRGKKTPDNGQMKFDM
ncbi:hypothetical protein ACPV52_17105 [Vibrio astriarenae]